MTTHTHTHTHNSDNFNAKHSLSSHFYTLLSLSQTHSKRKPRDLSGFIAMS